MKKRCLIIGSSGQDGTLLFDHLDKAGHSVLGISKRSTRSNEAEVAFGSIDISEPTQVRTALHDYRPHEIYYLAAYHHSATQEPASNTQAFRESFKVHAEYPLHFLEEIRRSFLECRFFYASSSHIFGGTRTPMQTETTPPTPNDFYGMSKLVGLELCQYYRNRYRIFASAGILYNHESHLRQPKYVSAFITERAVNIKRGTETSLELGDLSATVDWGYAPDFVDAIHRILQLSKPDDFIVSTGKAHTVLDYVKVTFGALGLTWQDHVRENRGLLKKPRKTLVGDSTKLRELTGWKPSIGFEEMIHKILKEKGAL